jgi:hypothetical protein
MKIETRHFGIRKGKTATIIELAVNGSNAFIVEDITNLHGYVDSDLIDSLRMIADELEDHNNSKKEEEKEL